MENLKNFGDSFLKNENPKEKVGIGEECVYTFTKILKVIPRKVLDGLTEIAQKI